MRCNLFLVAAVVAGEFELPARRCRPTNALQPIALARRPSGSGNVWRSMRLEIQLWYISTNKPATMGEQQIRIIRESVIMMHGHFGFIVRSTDLYQKIATQYINPCIRMAAELPVGAGPAEQEEAKQQLQDVAEKSSAAIQELARREFEDYEQRLSSRVQEIDDEISAMGLLPAPELDNGEYLQAVDDGVREANQELCEKMAFDAKRFGEFTDNI
jgi:hypothetical protein